MDKANMSWTEQERYNGDFSVEFTPGVSILEHKAFFYELQALLIRYDALIHSDKDSDGPIHITLSSEKYGIETYLTGNLKRETEMSNFKRYGGR